MTRPAAQAQYDYGSAMHYADEAGRLGLAAAAAAAAAAGGAAGRRPRRRTLFAVALGSFLLVAPYALARATRRPPDQGPGDQPNQLS